MKLNLNFIVLNWELFHDNNNRVNLYFLTMLKNKRNYLEIAKMPNVFDVDEIVNSCLDIYKKLPKSGKVGEHEWTVLACVVEYHTFTKKHIVISLGTGSKCIGATKMRDTGNILNDSHAEVVARRGFLVYLYQNIENALNQQKSIFIYEEGSFKLKPGIEFLFYSSQLPCGDASIIPKTIAEEYGHLLHLKKRPADNDACDLDVKKTKGELVDDIHRTGAKCLPAAEQDTKKPGINYHTVGQVRTKPGRGDVTLSVSCSDKMARWIHVGIQGALLDMLLVEPIFIKCFIFGAGVPYSTETLERALLQRSEDKIMTTHIPKFCQSRVEFPNKKTEANFRPPSTGIIWIRLSNNTTLLEVASNGMKLGLIKKMYNLVSAYLSITKYKLYMRFINILEMKEEVKLKVCGDRKLDTIPYNEMKNKAVRYQSNWKHIKENFFKTWTEKPDMWNFCIKNT